MVNLLVSASHLPSDCRAKAMRAMGVLDTESDRGDLRSKPTCSHGVSAHALLRLAKKAEYCNRASQRSRTNYIPYFIKSAKIQSVNAPGRVD